MRCVHCGNNNRPEAKYCGHCGANIHFQRLAKRLAAATAAAALLAALCWAGYSAWDRLTLPGCAAKAIDSADKILSSAVELGIPEKDLSGARSVLRSAKEYSVVNEHLKALVGAREAASSAQALVNSALSRNTKTYAQYYVDGEEKLKAGDQ